ncbi:MAG TPA: acyltransferase [Acidimicrobiia bacterium]|nr:acyltransferase [Acidimicrobiia bacterium]
MSVDESVRVPAPSVAGSADERFARVPALDGIRALAIAAVLAFHNYSFEGFRHWGGGFLGVDVFFVLSGFLITTLLLREQHGSGRIDLRRFWTRRARRLLPAVCVLILLEAIVAQFVLDPVSARSLRGDGIGTLFYFENWRLAVGSATTASHTWSLAVEEQWYLVWPLLLVGLLYLARGRARIASYFVGLLAVASAVECAVLYRGDGTRAYFGTDTRAQALLIGALLALVLLRRPRGHSRLVQFGGWGGAAFLVWIFATLKGPADWIYSGGFFAVAVASALVIAAVTHSEDAPLARILSLRPLVAVGIVSYGLYLYHLPIFLWLTPSSTNLDGLQLLSLRIGVTSIIAVASYHLVEKRFMRRRSPAERQPVAMLLAGAAVALAVIIAATPSSVHRSPADVISYALRQAAEQTPTGLPRVMLVGDTPVIQLAISSAGVFEGNAIRGAPYAMTQCDIVPGAIIDEQGTQQDRLPKCALLGHNMREVMTAFRPKYGVLMLGPTDARDRVAKGRPIRFRSNEQRALVYGAIDQMRGAVEAAGGRFVLLPVRCDGSASVPGVRVDWLNRVLADYARLHLDVAFKRQAIASCTSNPRQRSWTWPELQRLVTSN